MKITFVDCLKTSLEVEMFEDDSVYIVVEDHGKNKAFTTLTAKQKEVLIKFLEGDKKSGGSRPLLTL